MTVIISGTDGVSDVDGSAGTPAIRGTDANTGIFFGADQVGVATNGVERVEFGNSETVFNDGGADVDFRVEGDNNANLLFVDASADRVGIGTSSPVNKLQVGGYAGNEGEIALASGTSGNSSILFGDGPTSTDVYRGYIQYNHTSDAMLLATSAQERARITSGGELFLGTTTSVGAAKLLISYVGSVHNAIVCDDNANLASTTYALFTNSGVAAGSIVRVGATAAVVYNTSSDYRLKTVVGPVANAGQRIDALQPVEYTWNETGQSARGFIAHQFQEVYPNSVTGTKDGVDAEGKPVYQAMQASTSEVIADLVSELKLLRARVAALEAQ